MEKIVVLTGSFNPPTLGHLRTIVKAMDLVGASKGYFVPASETYVKEKMVKAGERIALSDDIRNRMLIAMCRADKRLCVDTLELESGDSNHSYITLSRIQDKNPGSEIYHVIGSDKLKSITHWHNAEELLSRIHFIIFSREDDNLDRIINGNEVLRSHKGNFVICSEISDVSDVSSSKVRHLFEKGDKSYSELLYPAAAPYFNSINLNDYPVPEFTDIVKALKLSGRHGLGKALKFVYETNREFYKGRMNDSVCRSRMLKMMGETKVYSMQICLHHDGDSNTECKTYCVNADPLEVVRGLRNEGLNPALLNTASRVSPARGYSAGIDDPEAELCRRSDLALSLYQFGSPKLKAVKDSGASGKGNMYPLDIRFGGIYSPCVSFFRTGIRQYYDLMDNVECSVISVPCLSGLEKESNTLLKSELKYFTQDGLLNEEGRSIMADKIRTIFRIALENGHDSVVLSDFGVKYYHLAASDVAALFSEVLAEAEFTGRFIRIVFALPEGKGSKRYPVGIEGPFAAFYKTFGTC